MLSENYVQKDEGHIFSLLYGIYIKDKNIHKTNMIIYKYAGHVCNS
jgi:hypothetical protein